MVATGTFIFPFNGFLLLCAVAHDYLTFSDFDNSII